MCVGNSYGRDGRVRTSVGIFRQIANVFGIGTACHPHFQRIRPNSNVLERRLVNKNFERDWCAKGKRQEEIRIAATGSERSLNEICRRNDLTSSSESGGHFFVSVHFEWLRWQWQ